MTMKISDCSKLDKNTDHGSHSYTHSTYTCLPYTSLTGSSPSFALFTLVRTASNVFHVTSLPNLNQMTRVCLKQSPLYTYIG